MLLDHRDKADKWKQHLSQAGNKRKACSGGDPLNRKRIHEPGSGHEPEDNSMCRRYREADDGTWREGMMGMLIDGSIQVMDKSSQEEYCREVTGEKINKRGRW